MSARRGKIISYNPANKQGEIEPDDRGPRVKFLLQAVTNKDPEPKLGDLVSFDAPPPRKNKKGTAIQDPATVVTIAARAAAVAAPVSGPSATGRTSQLQNGGKIPVARDVPVHVTESISPALFLDKFVVWPTHRERRSKGQTSREPIVGWEFKEEDKANFLRDRFVSAFKQFYNSSSSMWSAATQRWNSLLTSLERSGCQVRKERLKTSWRLTVHLGRASILENTGVALHRIYGFPIIPGQSLKGLAHAYIDQVVYPRESRSQEQTKLILDLFGSNEQSGNVMFLDAVPTTIPDLEIDILNCHFPEWYGDGKPPSDDQNPKPVYFLTVAPGSEFLFAVATRHGTPPEFGNTAFQLLVEALRQLGAGAKTAAGYGYFV